MKKSDAWEVRFIAGARKDIAAIARYLLENEGADFARAFADSFRTEAESGLESLPFRGRFVPELEDDDRSYREIRIKSYRAIFLPISEKNLVEILLVAHERRDIRDLLARVPNKKTM